jgi:hypothetical protein
LGFTLIIDDINAVMISAAESVPLRMTFPAWRPTNTGILIAENISGGVRRRRSAAAAWQKPPVITGEVTAPPG